MAGHPGFLKTYSKVRERFTWKGLKDDVLMYVKECSACQQNKVEHTHPVGLLQPLPILDQKWEKCIHGIYHSDSKVTRERQYLCGGGQVEKICIVFY